MRAPPDAAPDGRAARCVEAALTPVALALCARGPLRLRALAGARGALEAVAAAAWAPLLRPGTLEALEARALPDGAAVDLAVRLPRFRALARVAARPGGAAVACRTLVAVRPLDGPPLRALCVDLVWARRPPQAATSTR